MKNNLLKIIKSNLGFSTSVKDNLLLFLIDSTLNELSEEHKLTLNEENFNEKINLKEFVISYVCFKYKNSEYKEMPRYLKARLNNLKVNRLRTNKNDV